MAYNPLKLMDIHDIIVRWHSGYNNSEISRALTIDRKTVGKYIQIALDAGISKDEPLPSKAELLEQLESLQVSNERSSPAWARLEKYKDEIISLVTDKSDPLKPKTAFEVIGKRHDLTISYSTFKRFVKHYAKEISNLSKTTCRIETQPGVQVQIDYAKMGLLYDPLTQKNRVVYAFISTLSFSRLKYVEFVYSQNQKSFVASHTRMFEFFDGVPKAIVIDNLKSGVIKPNLYDPHLNPTYQEMAEHYGTFIDAARVRHPKDKGKIERAVQIVREEFRKLKALYSDLVLNTANDKIRNWCRQDNGMKNHGTTGLKPSEVYQNIEKKSLSSLPISPFELTTWKEAKVHADQFVQFEKQFCSVPEAYVGKTVWVRGSEKMIQIFYEHQLIKQHPRQKQLHLFDSKDFPKRIQGIIDPNRGQHLTEQAETIGINFKELIQKIVSIPANLNYRRAEALLKFRKKYPSEHLEEAAKIATENEIFVPEQFQHLLDHLQNSVDEPIPVSTETKEFIRDMSYFIQ